MHAPLTTNRQRFFHLYSLVCEDFPAGLVDGMIRDGHEAKMSDLLNVRTGRKSHLPWLIDMVKRGIPQFPIPDNLHPVVAADALLFEE
ncbi:hypothetical protein [Hymenobacter terricola]|uniref:hypothetical protein n=1 Tax=Hymenobacter terricola TaxID=2819236 RepID=UPI001B306A43|nr:hypothetical protein [Hymenobacter terricola]